MKIIETLKALFGLAKQKPDETRAFALELLAEIKTIISLVVSLVKSAKSVRTDVKARLEAVRDKLGDVKDALEEQS